MNRTLKLLLLSDLFVLTGFGLTGPILAIFIKDNLVGGTIPAAGAASALFFIVKAAIQLPFSKYIDTHEDRIKWLRIGTVFIAITPFIYIFSGHIITLFIAQVIYGIGAGMASPAWLSLWSTHLEKHHESYEWSAYSASIGIGLGLTALAGAFIAELIGFVYTFIFVGAMSLAGCIILFYLEKDTHKSGQVSDELNPSHFHKRRKLVQKHGL